VRSSIDGRCAFLTLFAFVVVLLGVLALHITQPGLDRPFRAPAIRIVAPAGAATSIYLMRPAGRYLGEVGGVACDWAGNLFCLWDAVQPAGLLAIANRRLDGCPLLREERIVFLA